MDDAENQQNLIIYRTADGKAAVSLYARDGDVWMNQNQLAELFATSVPNINTHIANILKEKELSADSVIKDYLITAADGKRFLAFNDKPILSNQGRVSHAHMEQHVAALYDQFDARRKLEQAREADANDLQELDELEKAVVGNKRGKV